MSLERFRRTRMVVLNRRSTPCQAARAMEDNHIGAVLVSEPPELVGIVTDRDPRWRCLAADWIPVPGAVEVIRGGDVISFLGFNVGLRSWVEKNGETAEKFLAAVSEADKWMRDKSQAGSAGGDALDPRPQSRDRGSCDAVQHPAGRSTPVGQQLSSAVECSGSAAPAWLHTIHLRRQQAHRA
jgi:hypothetical protein